MADYSPSIKACRLFEKTSKNGQQYFTGRLGFLRVALVKSKEVADDGSAIWSLMLSEAPPKQDAQRPSYPQNQQRPDQPAKLERGLDDEIPF